MTVTLSKLLSLPVVAASLFLVPVLSNSTGSISFPFALVFATLGLALVWFPEELADTDFQRGIYQSSPTVLVAGFGWLFLVGYPVLLVTLMW